jgi:hypothetical protein
MEGIAGNTPYASVMMRMWWFVERVRTAARAQAARLRAGTAKKACAGESGPAAYSRAAGPRPPRPVPSGRTHSDVTGPAAARTRPAALTG